ncbi:hypothetical protein B6F84_00030 [Acidianus manzaensis]|uniref:Uncharacterized protein n=1 Tax=Acidianus manzaensis TaxID=282676 RepID=A0A1W6JWD5_9CREN|nr:hypothetical protein B6F84_00030 [Acidianus manzaensis]
MVERKICVKRDLSLSFNGEECLFLADAVINDEKKISVKVNGKELEYLYMVVNYEGKASSS